MGGTDRAEGGLTPRLHSECGHMAILHMVCFYAGMQGGQTLHLDYATYTKYLQRLVEVCS